MKKKYIFTMCHSKVRLQSLNFKSLFDYYLNYLMDDNATITRQFVEHNGLVNRDSMEYYDRRSKSWQKEYCEIF